MKDKKKLKYLVLPLTLLLVSIFSISYAIITLELTGERNYSMTIGNLDFAIEGETNAIRLMNAYPMADSVGQTLTPYTFTVTNTGTLKEYYKVSIVEDEEEKAKCTGCVFLNPDRLRYQVTIDGVAGDIENLDSSTVLDKGELTVGQTKNYELRIWMDAKTTSEDENKYYFGRIKVEASQEEIKQPSTEPNEPELTSGMIAVTYNDTDKTWVKADTSTNDWYDYDNQMWANAVTVTEETRANYMALDEGEPISMDDINTMWVWIPRYSYTIRQPYGTEVKCSDIGEITPTSPTICRTVGYPTTLREESFNYCKGFATSFGYDATTEEDCIHAINDVYGKKYTTFEEVIELFIDGGRIEDTRVVMETYPDAILEDTNYPGAIDIRFIKTTEKDTGTGKYEKYAKNWVTPDGFTFGNENIPGFWMAKFETSTLETCSATTDSVNTACDLLTLTPQVKPNVTSWRGARVSTFFEASRLMQSGDDNLTYNADTYGFDTVGTGTMDTHMLKNTEWGIVAMLSQSRYGKYGNSAYTGANKEVAINNCSSYITGIGGDTVSASSSSTTCTVNTYETEKGQAASTTGTIYGVYDMSGGAYEYAMGNYSNYSGVDAAYNSGFCGTNGPTEGTCREWPNAKYVDIYTSNTPSSSYKFGDATYETFGWYYDNMGFVNSAAPWSHRGGYYGITINAGVFVISGHYGNSGTLYSTRFVIKP